MKTSINEMNKIMEKNSITFFKRGEQWIVSYSIGALENVEALHHSINTKRKAMELIEKRLKNK